MHADLRQLQNKILELVEYFDAFCSEYDIEYYLMGGTALGVVRHKGFIPWDDDFDVFMDKENYNKFRNIVKYKLDRKKYYFQEEDSSENPLFFCKLRMNNTALIEIDTRSRIMHQGIFLDIMPLDNASDNLFLRYIQYICARILSARTLGEKGYITDSLLKRFLIFIAKILVTKGVKSKLKSMIGNSNRKETKMTGFFFGRTKYKNIFFPKTFLKRTKRLDFEKISLPVFEDIEEYLKITFGGGFMNIPSQEERKKYPQHAFLFDVNKSYKYYLNGLENWRKYNGTIIPHLPPDNIIKDSINSIRNFIKSNNAWFARWASDFDCKDKTEFWYIIQDKSLGIEDYSANRRNQIRKGLKHCSVKLVDRDEIINKGYSPYCSAFSGYDTHEKPLSREQFVHTLNSFDSNTDYWGIFNKEEMIGYSINIIFEDYCDYTSIKLHPEFLKLYPSYALIYTMNNYYLDDRNFRYVNNGSRSLSHNTNIQSFLLNKFKFRKAYCKMNIIYSPFIALAIKFIFPLRFIIKNFNNKFANRLLVLIRHEKIRRSFL